MPNLHEPTNVDAPMMDPTLSTLASEAGVRVIHKNVIRFPAIYLKVLQQTVERYNLTGQIRIDYSQGHAGFVTFEGVK
jgi:hypothetical protein